MCYSSAYSIQYLLPWLLVHDIELEDDQGRLLVRRRLPEGAAGLATLHALVGDHLVEGAEPEQVLVGIETDRGPWVQALIAAGEDPASAEWGNASAALASFQNGSGAFRYMRDMPDDNLFATVQAIPALAGTPFPIAAG